MKGTLKRQNGITLISLVITIIVLLILAGVSIGMITGENGIIRRANEAADLTAYKTAEEKVNLAVIAAMEDDGEMTVDELKTEVEHQGGTVNGTTFPVQVQMDGYTFEVTVDGEITGNEGGGDVTPPVEPPIEEPDDNLVTSEDIANATQEELQVIYGATVHGYEVPVITDVGWKIFYADENNIYLIADNYIEEDNFPYRTLEDGTISTNKTWAPKDEYPRSAFGLGGEEYKTGTERIKDSKLKSLNHDYFNTKKYTSTNYNMQAVAYFMDTNAWNRNFKDVNNKAEYVVGGPTIEMLFKSYNQKHGTNYQARAKDAIGYEISLDGGTTWSNVKTDILDVNDSLYIIKDSPNACGMWIASPATAPVGQQYSGQELFVTKDYLGAVQSEIDLYWYNYNPYNLAYYGMRPVVCLKSDVKLEKNEDGTFTIK